jgi:hypothetical protein
MKGLRDECELVLGMHNMRASFVDNTRVDLLKYIQTSPNGSWLIPQLCLLFGGKGGFSLALIRARAWVKILKWVVRRSCQCGVHV